MHVVSENSPADIARNRAREDAQAALLDLTVNLLRVVRGAGKPYQLQSEMLAFLKASQAHWDAADCYLSSSDLADAVAFEHPYTRLDLRQEQAAEVHAEAAIMRASLQYVASTLARQPTQQATAHHDFIMGQIRLQEARAAERARWDCAFR